MKSTGMLVPFVGFLMPSLFLLVSCGGTATIPATGSTQSPTIAGSSVAGGSAQAALAPETNPAGDIPDNQAFVPFTSPTDGYTVQIPEGWARATTASGTSFTDKFNGVAVEVSTASAAPSVVSVQSTVVPALEQSSKAVKVTKVEQVSLPAGPAVRVTDTANSDPNAVTGKQVRLEEQRYLFFKNGKQVTLTLWAPQGADNVDAWQQIAASFRWSA